MPIKYAKKISEKDNVATCVADISKGEIVTVKFDGAETQYTALSDIPFGHKIALQDIDKDGEVIKYGVSIGKASEAIPKGQWVHCHNCIDTYEVK